ncbi:PTS glucose transporter subunit IIA [Janibacter sp. Soil728]|uniref:PTS sugar transporter subunit IIA n=1 Tax=Janibacter sp. Soil728 TaxID=1736393 RepID=UPI0006F3D5E2|nr:PTS glucose transporter subunit IIA [Janibacter sp. Soil728]KRE37493.1 PTS glucose transporter subunit IIA [Janibacter sp. Soil728]
MSEVLAPCAGRVLPITECVDEVFAGQLVGPGLVIEPPDGIQTVVAPIAGAVMKIHPHAFVVVGEGAGVLVHLGINTVRLEGAGFEVHTTQGSTVSVGDPIISWDPATLPSEAAGQAISRQVPVVVLDAPADSLDLSDLPADVVPGASLFALP